MAADGHFAKSDATVLSPFASGEIEDENSVVHCIVAHPSHPMAQRSTLR